MWPWAREGDLRHRSFFPWGQRRHCQSIATLPIVLTGTNRLSYCHQSPRLRHSAKNLSHEIQVLQWRESPKHLRHEIQKELSAHEQKADIRCQRYWYRPCLATMQSSKEKERRAWHTTHLPPRRPAWRLPPCMKRRLRCRRRRPSLEYARHHPPCARGLRGTSSGSHQTAGVTWIGCQWRACCRHHCQERRRRSALGTCMRTRPAPTGQRRLPRSCCHGGSEARLSPAAAPAVVPHTSRRRSTYFLHGRRGAVISRRPPPHRSPGRPVTTRPRYEGARTMRVVGRPM